MLALKFMHEKWPNMKSVVEWWVSGMKTNISEWNVAEMLKDYEAVGADRF